MARVPYVTRDELLKQHESLLGSYSEMDETLTPHVTSPPPEFGASQDDTPPKLYQAMANNPPILEAFRRMASALRAECGLDERRREVVILTVARVMRSEYEWHQHVRIGRAVGLTTAEIRAISSGRDEIFNDTDRVLIEYVRHFVSGEISNEHHSALSEHFDESETVGIAMIAQFYLGLSHVIKAFDLEIGEPFVGWELERLGT